MSLVLLVLAPLTFGRFTRTPSQSQGGLGTPNTTPGATQVSYYALGKPWSLQDGEEHKSAQLEEWNHRELRRRPTATESCRIDAGDARDVSAVPGGSVR